MNVVTRLLIYVLSIVFTMSLFVIPSLAANTAANTIVAIDQGSTSTFMVKDDGTVWSCGQNWGGILGDGTTNNRCILGPTYIDNVKKISVSDCGVLLKTDGTVWTWGDNRYSVRGYATSDNLSFGPVPGLANVTDIYSSLENVFAIKSDGSVWAWGDNMFGALGDGTNMTRVSPVQVTGLPDDIVMIAPAGSFTLALDGQGRVWAWGDNRFGELGDGTNGTNTGSFVPKLVPIDDVKLIATSKYGTTAYALKDDGTVWAWGDNTMGEIGNGVQNPSDNILVTSSPVVVNGLSGVTAISPSEHGYVMVLKNDGTVWAWGHNIELLGDGTDTGGSIVSPEQVKISDAVAISCENSNFVMKSDGSLWAWGENNWGELGVGWAKPSNFSITDYVANPSLYSGVYQPTRVFTDPGATPLPMATLIPTATPLATPSNVTATPTGIVTATASPSSTVPPVSETIKPCPSAQLSVQSPVASQSSGFDLMAMVLIINLALIANLLLSASRRK